MAPAQRAVPVDRGRARRRRTALLLPILASTLLVEARGGPGRFADDRRGDTTSKDAQALLALVDSVPREAVTRELVALGPEVVMPLFVVLARGRWPTRDTDSPLGDPCQLTAEQREVVLAALETLRDPHLTRFLEEAVVPYPVPENQTAALLILAQVGLSAHLRLAGSIATGRTQREAAAPPPHVVDAYEVAVREILSRDPRALGELHRLWPVLPDELRPAVVRSIGVVGSEKGLFQLESWLWKSHGAERLLLAEIRRVLESLGSPPRLFPGNSVVSYLRHEDAAIRVEAAGCCALLALADAVPDLLDLLEDQEAAVRDAAGAALQRLTKLGFAAGDARRWRTWWESELDWWTGAMPGVVTRLRSGHAQEMAPALRELARHPLWRRELVDHLAAALRHDQSSIRELACTVAHLVGAVELTPDLTNRLEDRDEGVRQAAQAALRSWTRSSP